MKKIRFILLAVVLLLSTTTLAFAAGEYQTITLEMKDSYGDGWDGFKLMLALVNADGSETVLAQDITISSGSASTYRLSVLKDAQVRLYCQSVGRYTSEHSFVMKREGIPVFEHKNQDVPTEGQLFCTCVPINVQDSVVYWDVAPTYTVTIPAGVSLGQSATISAENVVLAHGEQVQVILSEANGFQLTSPQGARLDYTVKQGQTTVRERDVVLSVNPANGSAGSATLSFASLGASQFAGDYTGFVTFTIVVTSAEHN